MIIKEKIRLVRDELGRMDMFIQMKLFPEKLWGQEILPDWGETVDEPDFRA